MHFAHPVFRHLACAAMGIALFLTAGGHYAVLQTVAWTTMVGSYARSGSITEAVGKTFDGKHPCAMCKKIAAQRAHEEKAPVSVKAEKKAEVFVAHTATSIPLPRSESFVYASVPTPDVPARSDAPPVPVPRDSVS